MQGFLTAQTNSFTTAQLVAFLNMGSNANNVGLFPASGESSAVAIQYVNGNAIYGICNISILFKDGSWFEAFGANQQACQQPEVNFTIGSFLSTFGTNTSVFNAAAIYGLNTISGTSIIAPTQNYSGDSCFNWPVYLYPAAPSVFKKVTQPSSLPPFRFSASKLPRHRRLLHKKASAKGRHAVVMEKRNQKCTCHQCK